MPAQILTNIEHILKDKYQPALDNQLGISPSPLFEKMAKTSLTNHTIKSAAPYGLNGGFGFGAEGVNTPAAGPLNYIDFEVKSVDMYVDLEISNKTIQLANSNMASMIRALDSEVTSSYATAEWNMSRSLFGDGTGILTTTSAVASSTSVTVADVTRLKEGLIVDIYEAGAAVGSTPKVSGRRIAAIDRTTNTITLSGAAVTVGAGFMTCQGSYGRELNGLGCIYDDAIATYAGQSKETYPFLMPVVVDAGNDITDLVIYDAVKKSRDIKGGKIDLLMMGDNAFSSYQEYMKINNVQIVENQNFMGGAVGYKVIVGNQTVTIINESFVPTNEAWGVDTTQFYFEKTTLDFVSHESSIFNLRDNTSIFRALMGCYGNIMCKNPGSCIRITNCNATATSAPTSIAMSDTAETIEKGATYQLTVNFTPASAASGGVVWYSSNTAAATVSGTGLVTVPSDATSSTTATITAISKTDNTKTCTCTVTVGS